MTNYNNHLGMGIRHYVFLLPLIEIARLIKSENRLPFPIVAYLARNFYENVQAVLLHQNHDGYLVFCEEDNKQVVILDLDKINQIDPESLSGIGNIGPLPDDILRDVVSAWTFDRFNKLDVKKRIDQAILGPEPLKREHQTRRNNKYKTIVLSEHLQRRGTSLANHRKAEKVLGGPLQNALSLAILDFGDTKHGAASSRRQSWKSRDLMNSEFRSGERGHRWEVTSQGDDVINKQDAKATISIKEIRRLNKENPPKVWLGFSKST